MYVCGQPSFEARNKSVGGQLKVREGTESLTIAKSEEA